MYDFYKKKPHVVGLNSKVCYNRFFRCSRGFVMKKVVEIVKKVASVFKIEDYEFEQKKQIDNFYKVQKISQDKMINMLAASR